LPAGSAARTQAPTTLPTFPSEDALTKVDAVALEAAERSIAGLRRDDFVLSEDGHLQETASFGIALDGMPDGRYDLVLDVDDEVSGARLERHEAFIRAMEPASP
jgi:hypothetical protein